MWWDRSKVGDIYLATRTLAVRTDGPATHVQAISDADWKSKLADLIAQQAKWRWRVWLGGNRCALQAVDPLVGLRNVEEAEIALSASLSEGGNEVEAHLAAWPQPSDSPWIVGVTPVGLVADLVGVAESSKAALSSIRPWWSSHAKLGSEGTAFMDGESINYWRIDAKGRIASAGTLLMPPSARTATVTLRRLQAAAPLKVWQLDVYQVAVKARMGFAIHALEEQVLEAPNAAI